MLKGEVPGVLDANGSGQKKKIVNDIKNTVKKTVQSEQSEAKPNLSAKSPSLLNQ